MRGPHASKVALYIFASLVCLWLVAPVLIMVPLAFSGQQSFKFPPESYSLQWFDRLFSDASWNGALVTTLTVSFFVVIISVVLGTACALGLDRSMMPGKSIEPATSERTIWRRVQWVWVIRERQIRSPQTARGSSWRGRLAGADWRRAGRTGAARGIPARC